jgi:hypothetical protein
MDYVWRASVPPEAVGTWYQQMGMIPISVAQVPKEFWKMPADWSEMPPWWDPKPVAGSTYYMDPAFKPRSVINEQLDCLSMYDPSTQTLYVWSQFDF